MSKLIYGIGFNSKHTHYAFRNGRPLVAYTRWRHIIQRCYDPNRTKRNNSYHGCEVVKQWHDFQNFAEWFEGHEYSNLGYDLDKDLLIQGNKVYSPDSCCFLPQSINKLFTDRRASRGDCPQGVCWDKPSGKYKAELNINSKKKNLGRFTCPNEAHQAYKVAKEANVKRMALEWQDRIASDVFDALMNWSLN